MQLTNLTLSQTITLPNDMLWVDEMQWVAPVSTTERTLAGSLVVQGAVRLKGRPITLQPAQRDMAWVTRAIVTTLQEWASVFGTKFTLQLQYPTDTRAFTVSFRHDEKPMEAEAVLGFPQHDDESQWVVTLRFMEVDA